MRAACPVMITALLAACGPPPVPVAPASNATVEPELPAIPWSPVGEPRTYDAENLWDAINGAADGYLAYGFVRLTIQDYASDGAKASVEVYDQGTPLNAFGVYRRDRPPESTGIAVGADALISSPHHCAMLAGAKYVQARALEGTLDEAGCRGLFAGLLDSIPGPYDLPAELDLLPRAACVAGSEGFTVESYLGLTDLARCLHAEYQGAEATYRHFACIETEGRDAAAIWAGLSDKWTAVEAGDDRHLHREVPYTGEVVVARTATGILGVAGAGDLAASLELLRGVEGD